MDDYIDEVVENAADSKQESDSKTESNAETRGFNTWPMYATISLGFVGMGREAGSLAAFIPAAGFGLAGVYDFLKNTGYNPQRIVNTVYQKIMGKN